MKITDDNKNKRLAQNTSTKKEPLPTIDENMHLFVYGNLTIKDVETGETLVNKRI